MAKDKKKNLKPIYWLIIAEVIVIVGGLLLGFKITYAPHLENDWDAISACASWASVVVAGLAIYYAILVPKKIAEDQNRISLFEKRLDVYLTAETLIGCAHQIKDTNDSGIILSAFFMSIGKQEDIESSNLLPLFFALDQMERTLLSGGFLFPGYDANKMSLAIIEARNLLIEADKCMEEHIEYGDCLEDDNSKENMKLSKEAQRYRNDYCTLCFSFMKEYASVMEEQLNLINNK